MTVRLAREARMATTLVALALSTAAAAHAEGNAGSLTFGGSTEGAAPEPAGAAPAADHATAAPKAKDTSDPNPPTWEFAFVSVGSYQSWSIAGRWLFLGAGGGLGPPLYRYSKMGDSKAGWDPSLEVVYGGGFVRVAPVPYVDIDVGTKIAIVSALYAGGGENVKDPPQSGFSYGGYVDLRVGSRTIKFGPRFEYGGVAYQDYRDKGWRFTPLMLRVVH